MPEETGYTRTPEYQEALRLDRARFRARAKATGAYLVFGTLAAVITDEWTEGRHVTAILLSAVGVAGIAAAFWAGKKKLKVLNQPTPPK